MEVSVENLEVATTNVKTIYELTDIGFVNRRVTKVIQLEGRLGADILQYFIQYIFRVRNIQQNEVQRDELIDENLVKQWS